MKLSSQSDGITPQLKTAYVNCLTSPILSSLAVLSISAMMPDGSAALHHFADQGRGHPGRGSAFGGTPGARSLLGHSNSTFNSLAYCSIHVFTLSSSVSASSPASLRRQFSSTTSWFVLYIWRYGKHHHHLGILWRMPLSLPQTLEEKQHASPCPWRQCKQFLPLWLILSCFPSSENCRLWTMQPSAG